MADWLKGCEICNAGLCARFDELIESGMSQRQAARELEQEQREKLGQILYPSETLRRRFWRNKPQVVTNVSKTENETCSITDLHALIVAGRA
jgi:hypothetical protein